MVLRNAENLDTAYPPFEIPNSTRAERLVDTRLKGLWICILHRLFGQAGSPLLDWSLAPAYKDPT